MSDNFTSWFPSEFAASLFIIVYFFWTASELFKTVWSRRHQFMANTQHKDHGSYWIILAIVWGSMIISLLLRSRHVGVFQNNFQYIGIGIEIIGIALREWAVLTLGRSFSVVVAILPGQTIVQNGPYRWVRHPAYTGSILTLIGFALGLGAWIASLVILVICFVGFLYRIQVEEKALVEVFGKEYQEYMQRTWRLFPGL